MPTAKNPFPILNLHPKKHKSVKTTFFDEPKLVKYYLFYFYSETNLNTLSGTWAS